MAGTGIVAGSVGYLANLWRVGGLSPSPAADVAAAILDDSSLTDLEGSPQTLTRFRGKVLIVNFWATWCAPCREEIPLFIRLQRELGAKGVQFVGIAIDQPDKVRDFANEFQVNYPLLIAGIDAVELSRKAGNKAGVLPYTLVFNRSGVIAASLVGVITEARMREKLRPLL